MMEWNPETADPAVGSFMPGLRWAVEHTEGPILELGAGYFSTPYLVSTGRPFLSYEFDPEWRALFKNRFPELVIVGNAEDIPFGDWSVVLIDCEGWERQNFYNRFRGKTEVFVIHDVQDNWILDLSSFKYRYDFDENPQTTLLSDVLDVRQCGC